MDDRKITASSQYENNIALLNAASQNNAEVIRDLLIHHKADRSVKDKNDLTAVEKAALKQHWKSVFAFTEIAPDASCIEGYNNALLAAVHFNQFNVAHSLLLAGAKPVATLKKTFDSCLHQAVRKNNPEMIKLLYRFGADLQYCNKQGHTPYSLASTSAKFSNAFQEIIQIRTFEQQRASLIKDLSDYASRWLSFSKRKNINAAYRLIKLCTYKAKSTKELITLLELEPKQGKDSYHGIINSHYQKLMAYLIEKELYGQKTEYIKKIFKS